VAATAELEFDPLQQIRRYVRKARNRRGAQTMIDSGPDPQAGQGEPARGRGDIGQDDSRLEIELVRFVRRRVGCPEGTVSHVIHATPVV
jgi:hypothetical protein